MALADVVRAVHETAVTRNVIVATRVTPAERDEIVATAKEFDCTPARLIRAAVLQIVRESKRPEEPRVQPRGQMATEKRSKNL